MGSSPALKAKERMWAPPREGRSYKGILAGSDLCLIQSLKIVLGATWCGAWGEQGCRQGHCEEALQSSRAGEDGSGEGRRKWWTQRHRGGRVGRDRMGVGRGSNEDYSQASGGALREHLA